MKSLLRLLALLALTACLAAPSHAQSSSDVSLSNLRWQLTDLNPGDGIVPSLLFRPMELGRHSSIRWQYHDLHTGMTRYDLAWGGGFPDVMVAAAPAFADEPHLRIDLAASIIGTTFQNAVVQATAQGLDRVGEMWGNIIALSDAINFTLSPGTGVSFFADASVHSTADREAGPGYMSIGDSFARIWFSPDRSNWTSIELRHIAQYGQANGEGLDQTLRVDYANPGIYDAHLSLHLEAYARVSTALAPIPEPASYLMLLAGMGLVLRWARCKATIR